MLPLSQQKFFHIGVTEAAVCWSYRGFLDTTSDRIAQELATLLGTDAGFCMNTISGQERYLLPPLEGVD
jgi:hypothetical protein